LRYKSVLLDMGGVLFDFAGGGGLPVGRFDWRGREALLHHISRHGEHVRLEDLENLLFGPWRRVYERRHERGREARWDPHLTRLRKRAHIRSHTVQLLSIWFRPFEDHLKPLEDVPATLAGIKERGCRVGLVSNVPLPGVLYLRVLRRHGLTPFFDSFHFSYDERSRKPSPAMLRRALKVLDCAPAGAIMVGDRRAIDVAAGRAAGTATAWLRTDDGGGPQADFEIEALPGLLDLL
jgi:HAD superfamily hydrolase (TIGR01549 family)